MKDLIDLGVMGICAAMFPLPQHKRKKVVWSHDTNKIIDLQTIAEVVIVTVS